MKVSNRVLSFVVASLVIWAQVPARAADVSINTPAVSGYDLVSYQTSKKPVRGNGLISSEYKGATYLFSSEENKKLFVASPEKYLPAYGGYCAYGVAINKKFDGDPNVYEVVDGKLYLNVTPLIKAKWSLDKKGNIAKADTIWPQIENKPASAL